MRFNILNLYVGSEEWRSIGIQIKWYHYASIIIKLSRSGFDPISSEAKHLSHEATAAGNFCRFVCPLKKGGSP